ncbi:hypothetical protein EI546_06100 [Aequorivita sp. H23M31]|uniref:Uncharacterized protein n=1 Tax=Aequorivita ciconiae TaxID=2494375 RepID=A0A410G230_9FLAO|nr:hypothetical protein [Aequorivita sp. H23M31]QAA81326.1 hypothetical protein EI546_06100 [Aequorivita sp. H23M31]
MQPIDLLVYVGPIISMEILAALVGTYYLKNASVPIIGSRYLVNFLWLTVFVEILGSYAALAYFSDYRYFSFVEDTPFRNNFWLFNTYSVINFSFYPFYFSLFLKNKFFKNLLKILIVGFIISSVVLMIVKNTFFHQASRFVNIAGTLLLFVSIILFYFELLRSDLLLQVKRFLPFYVSVAVLIFNLCITPMDILSQYFNLTEGNELFVKLHLYVVLFANVFLYAMLIFGFLICSKKKKFY